MSTILPWVRELMEELGGPQLSVGMRCRHPDGRLVEIISGQYWGEYGVSNFWYWREVLPDGTLSNVEESGYGWSPKP